MLITWFIGIPEQRESGISETLFPAVAALGEALMLYALLIPVALLWHFLDFVQANLPRSSLGKFLGSFQAFLSVMILLIVFWLLAGTGYFTYNSCDQLENAYFFQCSITVSRWIMVPIWCAIFSLVLLCTAKIFAALRSTFLRHK